MDFYAAAIITFHVSFLGKKKAKEANSLDSASCKNRQTQKKKKLFNVLVLRNQRL